MTADAEIERLTRETQKAEAACTAWRHVFQGIEAHLLDRTAMGDPADPERYLRIIQRDVARVDGESDAIVNARWADAARARAEIDRLKALLAGCVEALDSAMPIMRRTGRYECWDPLENDAYLKARAARDAAKEKTNGP